MAGRRTCASSVPIRHLSWEIQESGVFGILFSFKVIPSATSCLLISYTDKAALLVGCGKETHGRSLSQPFHTPCKLQMLSNSKLLEILGHPISALDDVSLHTWVIFQARKKLWRDEEVLRASFITGDVDNTFVHHTLVAWVHALVDLVNDSERSAGQGVQGQ